MNWLDIVIIIVLAIFVFSGLRIGFIRSVLALVGIIVGVILAGRFYVQLAALLSFMPDTIAKVVAFIIILVVVMIIAGLLGWLLTRVVSSLMLGWVNHLLGAVFGLVFGAVFCGAILVIWLGFVGTTGVITESAIAGFLIKYFPLVLAILPGEFAPVRSFFQ